MLNHIQTVSGSNRAETEVRGVPSERHSAGGKYYSQYCQDAFVGKQFFPKRSKGFFVEVGADDGVDKSNTLFFEDLGWEGICVEPSPSRFKELVKNRNCICLNKAIHTGSEPVEFIDIEGYGKGLSGIVENYDARHFERIERETSDNEATVSVNKVIVDCIPLSSVLEENGVTHVDFISIDVEGSELEVLESIDFKGVTFDVLLIEDNYRDGSLRRFMESKGFRRHGRIAIDEVFVNKSVRGDAESIRSWLFSRFAYMCLKLKRIIK